MAEVRWCRAQTFGVFGMVTCSGEMTSAAASNGSRDWTVWNCTLCGNQVTEERQATLSYAERKPTPAIPPPPPTCVLCDREGVRATGCKALTCSKCGVWVAPCDKPEHRGAHPVPRGPMRSSELLDDEDRGTEPFRRLVG